MIVIVYNYLGLKSQNGAFDILSVPVGHLKRFVHREEVSHINLWKVICRIIVRRRIFWLKSLSNVKDLYSMNPITVTIQEWVPFKNVLDTPDFSTAQQHQSMCNSQHIDVVASPISLRRLRPLAPYCWLVGQEYTPSCHSQLPLNRPNPNILGRKL